MFVLVLPAWGVFGRFSDMVGCRSIVTSLEFGSPRFGYQHLCALNHRNLKRLETLAVHDSGAGLIVLLLGDPHLLEGG